jgi:hypothetical protein
MASLAVGSPELRHLVWAGVCRHWPPFGFPISLAQLTFDDLAG